MIDDSEANRLLVKIAKAYYEDGLTQDQVGRRLGISRVRVSRLLRRARDQGIVRITVLAPEPATARLERDLEASYGLDEAVVVAPSRPDAATLLSELGAAAAQALVRCLHGCRVLGLTWGTTLLSVVDALPVQHWPGLRVCQLLGGLGQPEAEVYGADLARRTAETLGARLRLLPAPGIVASRLVRDGLLSDPQIADTLALGASADVALVGLGQPAPGSVVMQSGILTARDLRLLHERGAVGDIALRFFDAWGRPVEHEINERIIGPTLAQIRDIPRVIGVAGGESKQGVVRATLRGGLLDVLVTDEGTARGLLSEGGGDGLPG